MMIRDRTRLVQSSSDLIVASLDDWFNAQEVGVLELLDDWGHLSVT